MFSLKKKISTLATILALTSLLPLSLSAKENTDISNEIGARTMQVENVEVTIFDDGRIKGLNKEKVKQLSKKQKTKILKTMRFTDEEITRLPEDLQDYLVSEGGVKVDTVKGEMTHVYVDLEGNSHVVTEENEDEINQIKQKDLATIEIIAPELELDTDKVNTLGTNPFREGNFFGDGQAIYMGKTSNGLELEYQYITGFEWSKRPWIYGVDSIANAWQYHTVSTKTDGRYDVRFVSANGSPMGGMAVGLHDVQRPNPQSSRAKLDLDRHEGIHHGWLVDKVRVPANQKGYTGSFSSAYGHSWGIENISISWNGISYSFAGSGDHWSWDTTFTIGQDS